MQNDNVKLKIIQIGDNVLRQKAKKLTAGEINLPETQKLIQQMIETLDKIDIGVGLAAPQIGVSKAMFVVKLLKNKSQKSGRQYLVFINPRIIKLSGSQKSVEEGCLSVDGYFGKIKRYPRISIKAYNEKGEEFNYSGVGLTAQIIQHEIDHLNGALFIDKAKELRRQQITNN